MSGPVCKDETQGSVLGAAWQNNKQNKTIKSNLCLG